jgi:Xaa-Pro aminopeptidase
MNQIRYLTGFSGSSGLLILAGRQARFLTDFRYTDQARKQVKGARVHTVKGALTVALKDFPELLTKNRRYGYATETTTVASLRQLENTLAPCLLVPADTVFSQLGWVKEKLELAVITRAVEISDLAYERILNLVVPGIRERELAAELEYQMMMLGSEKAAFDTIVASGYRSAMPHGTASSKKLQKGDFVTFDFGATVGGYVADITRTVVVGKATGRQKKIYNLVLRAQRAAIRRMKPGVTCKAVDQAARQVITRAGYGKNFGHGTGHGISIEVHSGPRLSQLSDDKLKANNVVTVEPGIYISGWGGVRIEDDVLVTRTGRRVLNRATKKLLEL